MANESIRQIRSFVESAPTPLFLSGFFQSRPENFHNSEEVEWQIEREGEDVAVPRSGSDTGYNLNSTGDYVEKKSTPPEYAESEIIQASKLKKKQFGNNVYDDINSRAKATELAVRSASRLRKKIVRAKELQASQIFTTGKISLVNANNVEVFGEDFKPKNAHFPNAGAAWDTGDTAISDMLALAKLIRDNGKVSTRRVIMGEGSFEAALGQTTFAQRFEGRRANLGEISPMRNGGADLGNYRGTVEVGNYKLDIWTYTGRYKDVVSGDQADYLPDDKVIMMGDIRLDATFGGTPLFPDGTPVPIPGLQRRFAQPGPGLDVQFNSWISKDRKELHIAADSRPLLIPVQIDGFGCIDTLI